MNYRPLCEELTDRLSEYVPASDPLLLYARHLLAVRIGRPFERGEGNPAKVLTADDVRLIRRLRMEGLSYGQLAIRYGISKRQVFRICVREQWAWVD